jgi:hypothetical protein
MLPDSLAKGEEKLLRCLIKYNDIKIYGELKVKFHAFLTPELDDEWSASRSGPFNARGKNIRYLLDL